MKKIKRILVLIMAVMMFLNVGIDASAATVAKTLKAVNDATDVQADCETNKKVCYVDTKSEVNPYDVIYDYGETYEKYVDACDWTLVFDADYYMDQFPMLALQYHYDEELLIRHFQTVGIHEGRQGSKSFNVGAYMANCSSSVKKAMGDNYAGYYVYYMLHYDREKKVNTVSAKNVELKTQYTQVLTWFQANELKHINEYREEVGVDPVEFDGELAAFAMYRGYVNVAEGWTDNGKSGHAWLLAPENDEMVVGLIRQMAGKGFRYLENTITWGNSVPNYNKHCYSSYRNSKSHYGAMVDPEDVCAGISVPVWNSGTNRQSQFDVYLDGSISTPMHH